MLKMTGFIKMGTFSLVSRMYERDRLHRNQVFYRVIYELGVILPPMCAIHLSAWRRTATTGGRACATASLAPPLVPPPLSLSFSPSL